MSSNKTIIELFLRYQSKNLSSLDEEKIPDLLSKNSSETKLSIDVRSLLPQHAIDRCLRNNQELSRSNKRLLSKITEVSNSSMGSNGRRIGIKNNQIQNMFDRVALNDPEIVQIQIVSDAIFRSMNRAQILRRAQLLGSNSYVR